MALHQDSPGAAWQGSCAGETGFVVEAGGRDIIQAVEDKTSL